MDRKQAIVILALGCSLFGFLGICTRHFFALGLNSFDISFIRQSLTALALFVIIFLTNRKVLRIDRKDIPFLIVFGAIKLLSDIALFKAQENTTLALSALLQMTFPYYTLILSLFIFHEKITARKLIAMFVAFLGCVLVTGGLFNTGNSNTFGIICALFSGLCFGLYIIGNSIYVGKGRDPESYVFYCFLVSALIDLPFVDLGHTASVVCSLDSVGYALVFGFGLTLIPMFLLAWSANYLEATTISVVSMIEIVAAALVGFGFFSESLSASNIIGMVLVMFSVVILNLKIKKGADEYAKKYGIKSPRQMESKT